MAPIKEANAKPKFGHAAALFVDEPKVSKLNAGSIRRNLLQIRAFAIVAVFFLVGAFVTLNISGVTQDTSAETMPTQQAGAKIDVVASGSGNDELIGTLIHADKESSHSSFAMAPTKPIALNKQERERLLQIIGN